MKQIIFTFLVMITIVSCTKETANYVLLSGEITNANGKELKILNNNGEKVKGLTPNSEGIFKDTLNLEAGYYSLLYGSINSLVYFKPGYELNLTLDANQPNKTYNYTGAGSSENNYLIEKAKIHKNIIGEPQTFYTLEEAPFLAKAKEGKQALEKLLEDAKGVSKEFNTQELKNIFYNYAASLNNYRTYHSYMTQKQNFTTSEGFLDEVKNISFENESDYSNSSDYRGLVLDHYKILAFQMSTKESIDFSLALLKVVAQNVQNDFIKNSLLYSNAKDQINSTTDLQSYYAVFMNNSSNESHKNMITKAYEELNKYSKGQPSPVFADYENYKGGTTSLSDFKGKYVYIDIWATWCKPCFIEIPYLKKVEKKYHGKNIKFVSISVDAKKDHDAWKKTIVNKKLGGVQLFADNALKSSFVTDYSISVIPRFILIDPQGNIVESNAPKPSEKKLISLLDGLNL